MIQLFFLMHSINLWNSRKWTKKCRLWKKSL